MRIVNRANLPWFVFVIGATIFAAWIYLGNFAPQELPAGLRLPLAFTQTPSEHRSVGGTPVGLIFGATAFAIFIFAGLLGARKKVVLWRLGTLQRWMRAHIWLTLLTVPLVLFHSGFRFGGPMTTLLVVLYVVVMISGIYGLVLQHQLPHIMKERLPAETVYEQIPHIRAQLVAAAEKMRDSFKSADRTDSSRGEPTPPEKTDAGAPAPSAAKTVTAASTPMASTSGELSTPTARAKSVVGSTITAQTVPPTSGTSAAPESSTLAPPSGPTADKLTPASAMRPATAPPSSPAGAASAKPQAASDTVSQSVLFEFLDEQVLPYISARRGDRFRLGTSRYSEEIFRFVRLRVSEAHRARVEEIQAWCDERRMLDLQLKLQHWLHGWLFLHVPISFLLILLTAWHAYVTLFYY
jgi:hypothetical protein